MKFEKVKMKTLVEKVGIKKSTILYYVKEGIFSKPEMLSKNIHLYNISEVKIKHEVINLLQNELNSSIDEIKMSIGSLKIEKKPEKILKSIIECVKTLAETELIYTKKQFIEKISIESYNFLLKNNHIDEKEKYSDRDYEYTKNILKILNTFNKESIFGSKVIEDILNEYKNGFKSISISELEFLNKLKEKMNLSSDLSIDEIEGLYISTFNLVLLVKPFIQNKSTLFSIKNFDI